jgi:hypothetical protein
MSIDARARQAGADLRAATPTDVDASLVSLQRTWRRRRITRAAVGSLAVAATVAAAVWGFTTLHQQAGRSGQPVGPVHSPTQTGSSGFCNQPLVTCHGGRTYTIAMRVPMTWTLPRQFQRNTGPAELMTESYWTHHGHFAYITVLEQARAARLGKAHPISIDNYYGNTPGPAAGVAANAAALARWLADRPFLQSSGVTRTTFDGHPAWTVDVRLQPNLGPGPALCDSGPCYPLIYQPAGYPEVAGIWGHMESRYTVLDVPGAGTTVIWSGVFGDDPGALAENQRVAHTIHFGG